MCRGILPYYNTSATIGITPEAARDLAKCELEVGKLGCGMWAQARHGSGDAILQLNDATAYHRYFVKGAGRGTGGAHRVRSPARLAGPVAAARATRPASSAAGCARDQASPAPAAARGATMAAVRSRWAPLASSAVAHFPPTSRSRGMGRGQSARRGAGRGPPAPPARAPAPPPH